MKLRSINPYSGDVTEEFDPFSYEACREAAGKSQAVLKEWKKLPVSKRVEPLARLASMFRERKRKYAEIATMEMGKPIKQAMGEVEKCALACDYYYQNSEKYLRDEVIETHAAKSYVTFEPLGVILGIMPWNFPFGQAGRWAAPTLAAGNVCLLKHASNVPIAALEIEKAFREAGFPENAFQTLLIGPDMAERLIESDLIDGVSLTGSLNAGSKVGALAGKHIRKLVLELGGSDPCMIFEDADLEKAARTAVSARTVNAGQSCIAAKRMIVMEKVADEFLHKFLAVLNGLRIGDPMDETTDIGPIAREEFLQVLKDQLEDARRKGGQIHLGPKPPDKGFFFQPAVVTNVSPDMRVVKEEVFGPIAPLIIVKDEEEMIRTANGTEFGLGASMWTRDADRAARLVKEVQAGFVSVNGLVKSDPRLPFGGIKKSGVGRELAHYGLREFVNVKTVFYAK
ncbi:MAG: NAD-dependent succinate-semialdehyde dehydrogenase [Desulfobacteraceae bacterium]|nr:NAD-dependent succinate-semialdehyde dehydrogenase [Desulfobacteraceae bacterium]